MNPKVNTLSQDIKATNAINAYREAHGLARARNPYAWWVYAAVVLTYFPKGATFNTIRDLLFDEGITIDKKYNTLLTKFANQEERDAVQRNYTKNLPGIAAALGLNTGTTKAKAGIRGPRSLRTFSLKNTNLARQVLLTQFPHTAELFSYLDGKVK